jgi:hypothetical protein
MYKGKPQDFRTLVRAGDRLFLGTAPFFEKPVPDEVLTICGTVCSCRNAKADALLILVDVEVARYAPLSSVCDRILNGHFIELLSEKVKKHAEKYFLKTQVLELCEH